MKVKLGFWSLLIYLGGFSWVYDLPTGGFWKALVWPVFLGKFIAAHFLLF